jgi:hypothetical protein
MHIALTSTVTPTSSASEDGLMAELTDLVVGEHWAYRTGPSSSRFHQAEVLAVGNRKPFRVRIELLADEWQGDRRWVPMSRLEVRWHERAEYIAVDAKRRAVHAARPSRDDLRAVELILWKTVPMELVDYNMVVSGSCKLLDVAGTARFLGIDEEVLRADPSFEDTDGLVVAWGTTAAIARAAASRFPNPLLRYIEENENRHADEMKEGRWTAAWITGESRWQTPEEVQAIFETRVLPELNRLRDWIGAPRAADVEDRRVLLARLGRVSAVAHEALGVLEPTQKRIVARLRAELDDAMSGFQLLPGEAGAEDPSPDD